MKVKVLEAFSDKREGFINREKGEVIEITEARFKEINGSEYGIMVEEVKTTKKK